MGNYWKRGFGMAMAGILAAMLAGAALAACIPQTEGEAPPPGAAEDAAAEPEPEPEPEPTAYVRADDSLSNLQLADPTKPVYDRYTLAERAQRGLPTRMPELAPYEPEGKIVYLTFDDGPDAKNTPLILDILKEQGVPATFYVLGTSVEACPEVLKRIFDEGHAIGNHTYDHDYRALYPVKENFLAQLMRTEEAIQAVIGVRPLIVRAPGGKAGMFTDEYPPMLQEKGYVEHDWNASSEDATSKRPNAEMQVQFVAEQTSSEPKSVIVLMHSTGAKDETVKALPGMIQLFRDRGYSFGVVTPMTPQPW